MISLNKKIAIAAIIVVVIVVIAAIAVIALQPASTNNKVIYWTTIAPVNQEAALQAGRVDAAVSWEPYCSAMLNGGNASVVVWSNQVWPDHPCCCIAVKDSFTNNVTNQQLVARVVKANMVATDWVVQTINEGSGSNYTKLIQMGAQFSGVQPSVVESAVTHIKYDNQLTPAVEQWFANFTGMFANLGQLSDLTFNGYGNTTAFAGAITNTSYLAMASDIQPSNTILGSVRIGYLNGDLHQFARVVAMNTSLWGGKTLFQDYGVNVTSPGPYANGGAVMDAFAANTIDIGYLGCAPAILKDINAKTAIQIVSLVNSEGSAIIARGSIDSLSQLAGKIIATPGPASIQQLLLLYYCNLNGYTLKLVGT